MDDLKQPFLSICIPTYNRPKELAKTLDTIDTIRINEVEIVIRDNNSDDYEEVIKTVENFKKTHQYQVRYIKNEKNIGFDGNIRKLAESARGKWIIFMSDDDFFVEKALDKFIEFLKNRDDIGYVLRRFRGEFKNGESEEFRYYEKDRYWSPGEDAIVELFRKSIFLSGFTFRKECFSDYNCSDYDGTLLFQLYIMATICLKYPAAYCDTTITKMVEGGIPLFGAADVEKDLYVSGHNNLDNTILFLGQTGKIIESFDKKNGTDITSRILKDYSKYSFGYLHTHRDDGIKAFRKYAKAIKNYGLGDSIYFYIYYYGLLLLGRQRCQTLIRKIKKVVGKTPSL